ncbi:transglutaminase-like domain-containing protein [Myceligenerans pegani]|uniref:Transglutaminase domain-containing protein n=1 Tax=Myceligenerans pegani TaxID=2776917 RepID=A0ABR9MVS4_9MICO|nr:transglutaminase domain-containing protein [Myceligenerans sp. TRM 65318]MBE1875491.1 transglutaminase domain-containing protein [Myceligenerans sp. TRM 65318]MBE3017762.1 transglutaminase domain-containing protein [Myceligenerans sp. TRM 65318]
MTTTDALAYYTEPGPFTDPGPHRDSVRDLRRDIPGLLDTLHGLLIHEHLTRAYDVEHRPDHNETANLRHAEDLLARLLADGRPLTEPREPDERLGGTCRDFTILAVTALRVHGIPARARCGFGAYFPVPSNEDHWVAEYWNDGEGRWVLVDAQIDDRQRELFNTDIDVTDVPRDQFVVAGDAWLRCRAGEDDADRYGLTVTQEFGAWWIAANLIRDTAALSNVEMLPWDVWGAIPEPEDTIGPDLTDLLDRLAALTADPTTAAEARRLYDDARLRVPTTVRNANRGHDEPALLRG